MGKEQGIQGQHSPCENCAIENTSTCCNAAINHTDICFECGEHCDNACDGCVCKDE